MNFDCQRYVVLLAAVLLLSNSAASRLMAAQDSTPIIERQFQQRLDGINREKLFVEHLRPWTANLLQQRHSPHGAEAGRAASIPRDGEVPTLGMELCAARLYWLLGQNQRAIEVLDCVVNEFGEEEAPGLQIPAGLLAKLWIGTMHRWGGRTTEAVKVYDDILAGKWSTQIQDYVIPVCQLYRAALKEQLAHTETQGLSANNLVVRRVGTGKDRELHQRFYAELGPLAQTESSRVRKVDLANGFRPGALQLVIVHHLMLIGVLSDPISGFEEIPGVREGFLEMARRSGDSVDRELASHLLGMIAVASGEWAKAESIYNELFWCGTLRLPQSGLSLARCQALKGDPESAARTLNEVVQSFPNQAFEVFKLRKQILP